MDEQTFEKERQRVDFQNERARKLALSATLTIEQWIDTLNHFQWTCAYCSGPYEVLEHFIPLALQGETSVFNCLPSCFECNARKQDLHPGALSWIAPSTILYIRSYFTSFHKGISVVPLARSAVASAEDPDAIYTVNDLAKRLQVTEKTVYRLITQGKIQGGTRIQGAWRFSEADIIRTVGTLASLHTLSEVAKRFKVTEKTVHRWVNSNQLLSLRVGHRLLFESQEIKRFMDLRRRAKARKQKRASSS